MLYYRLRSSLSLFWFGTGTAIKKSGRVEVVEHSSKMNLKISKYSNNLKTKKTKNKTKENVNLK
jgi:hypothetical protein